ncbi:PucR family transcriptional regulator [Lentibacillus cibarius]|uniref:PucR family transcriptional regulator n=1 Tax=Lentibacillus cibarius TaxID=2583219 RepID=A0A5S3QJX0_9BACI|nr:helix-turn-helix domain-containing protein [Lentibacillus cibarius]TMN22224.1 hypothetical protein FFL34_08845 [Lentibacillus cibarius]
MKISFNDVLISVPLYQLTFLTVFPQEEIFYEHITTKILDEWSSGSTLLVVKTKEEWNKLNDIRITNQVIQRPNLCAIVVCYESGHYFNREALETYQQCQIPIVQINNVHLIEDLFEATQPIFHYNNLSLELDGFYKRGFMDIASNLSLAFHTPFLFLDDHYELLWHVGSPRNVSDCIQWLHTNQQTVNMMVEENQKNQFQANDALPYELYTLAIAGQAQLILVTDSGLALWQKRIIDKLIGFTAVLFQTEEVIRDQNDRFKESFMYELFYRKFESKEALVSQGKAWNWNLEKPHHLLVIEIEAMTEETNKDITLLDEIVFHLETRKSELERPLIIISFQEHIIILIESDEYHNMQRNKKAAMAVAYWAEQEMKSIQDQYNAYIGIGKWYKDTIDLNKSYQEAKMAIRFGKVWFEQQRVFHMSDLGVVHLLSNIDQDTLFAFCKDYLAPLINSDKLYDTDYLLTLKNYFHFHGAINEVAESLYIHPNTLRKRLNKIEKITGFNRQNFEQLLTIMIAIKIYYSFT